jgi:hypothetical protein
MGTDKSCIRREEATRNTWAYLEDNIRMDLREVVWEGVYWIYLLHNRDQWRTLVNIVLKLVTSSFSRRPLFHLAL